MSAIFVSKSTAKPYVGTNIDEKQGGATLLRQGVTEAA
jgi:hypothetical protein